MAERVRLGLDGLDDAVRRSRDDAKTWRNLVERLMMEAVHIDIGDADRLVESAPGLDCDRVAWMLWYLVLAVERGTLDLLPAYPAGIGRVVTPLLDETDVLHERAAEGNVSTWIPRHMPGWETPVERALNELELECIPQRIGRRQLGMRLLTVTTRLDIAAAAEDDPVADLEDVLEVVVPDAGQREWQAAGEGDGRLEPNTGVIPK